MQVHQYVYFAIGSRVMSAVDVTARLGIEADEAMIRGARRSDPPLPTSHAWRVSCRRAGLRVEEQIEDVVSRLRPHADRIGDLAAELAQEEGEWGGSWLQVVRIFEHPAGSEDHEAPSADGLVKLPGQHSLLGWHLDCATIDFLQRTRAEVDVDEYLYAEPTPPGPRQEGHRTTS